MARSTHDSEALRTLATLWGLVDTVDPPEGGDDQALADFHGKTHTYSYTLPSGATASS
jgi:hypothetical protein